MPDEPRSASDRALAAKIAGAYLRRNQIAPDQLASLIRTVHQALAGLGKSPAEPIGDRAPAVPVRRSITRDYVVCLECGWKGSVLRGHLTARHQLTPNEYRARWNLPRKHIMTAPAYSERRSTMAKQIGLGQLGGGSRTAAAPETPTPRRRPGRPRTPQR